MTSMPSLPPVPSDSPSPDPATPRQPEPAPRPVDPSAYETAARLSMPDAISGMVFQSLTPSGHTLMLDTGVEFGGQASGPEPLELLLVSLGACTGMDVISIMRKKRQKVTGYDINVYANRAAEHPRTYTEIVVEHVIRGEGIDPQALARSIELSITRYCPVHALLSRAIPVRHLYRIWGTPATDATST